MSGSACCSAYGHRTFAMGVVYLWDGVLRLVLCGIVYPVVSALRRACTACSNESAAQMNLRPIDFFFCVCIVSGTRHFIILRILSSSVSVVNELLSV